MSSESQNQFLEKHFCNTEILDEIMKMHDYVNGPFCDQQLQKPSVKYVSCVTTKTSSTMKAQTS